MNVEMITTLAKLAIDMPVYPDPRFPPSPYYRFLTLIAESRQPCTCVELGTCGGGAALHMCLGSDGRIVVSVDVVNDYPKNIAHIKSRFSNFQFCRMDSVEAAKGRACDVGVLFIDTIHTYDRTKKELDAWLPFLKDEAIVCLDDLYREGMVDFWNELPYEKVRLDFLHPSQSPTDGGFGVFIVRKHHDA